MLCLLRSRVVPRGCRLELACSKHSTAFQELQLCLLPQVINPPDAGKQHVHNALAPASDSDGFRLLWTCSSGSLAL